MRYAVYAKYDDGTREAVYETDIQGRALSEAAYESGLADCIAAVVVETEMLDAWEYRNGCFYDQHLGYFG